jgi:hypothetical protein
VNSIYLSIKFKSNIEIEFNYNNKKKKNNLMDYSGDMSMAFPIFFWRKIYRMNNIYIYIL